MIPVTKQRHLIDHIITAALKASDPYISIHSKIKYGNSLLSFQEHNYRLNKNSRVVAVAIGKAAIPMMQAIEVCLGKRLNSGLAVTKRLESEFASHKNVILMTGNHPIPGADSLAAGGIILSFLNGLTSNDLVIFLISGGGSALVCQPAPDITLKDLQETSDLLMRNEIPIQEINILRKHLDTIKGGGLLRVALPARTLSLVLSDVIGGDVADVASGPSVPDATTFSDCVEIFQKHGIASEIPTAVMKHMLDGSCGNEVETIKPGEINEENHSAYIVGNLDMAIGEAVKQAKCMEYDVYTSPIYIKMGVEEEARRIYQEFTDKVQSNRQKKVMMLWGGEAVIKRKGNRKGGRNLHLALLLAKYLRDQRGIYGATFATDGEDGSTDAAGAYFDFSTSMRGSQHGMDIQTAIDEQNSYKYFSQLDDTIKLGPTGTNVNDIVIMAKEST